MDQQKSDAAVGNSIKPLPENEKLLEFFLEQANRGIDYLELILRTQRFRAEQIRIASTDLRAVAPRLAMLHSLRNKLDEHTALDGPDCRELILEVLRGREVLHGRGGTETASIGD